VPASCALSRARVLASTVGFCAQAIVGSRTLVLAQTPFALKVGGGYAEAQAEVFYALDQGFFKKAGIDADVLIERSGSITMEAVLAGQLHTGGANAVSLGSALVRKLPVVVLAAGALWDARAPNAAIVLPPNSTVKTAKDLNGQTLGINSLLGIGQLAFASYLDQNGGDPNSVKYVELSPTAMADAVATGRVAAGVLDDPEFSNAMAARKVKFMVDNYSGIAKLFYISIWLSTETWLAQNKDVAKRFRQAIVAAGEWAESNPDQALVILEKYTKVNEKHTTVRYGRALDPGLLQPVFDAAYKYKIYAAPLHAPDYCWDGK
jgi:NitT/TauT family transport system substrate-binding protein